MSFYNVAGSLIRAEDYPRTPQIDPVLALMVFTV